MKNATSPLNALLALLSDEARRRGLNDAQWAQAACIRKETLSRLRGQDSCDFATLQALATAVGARIGVRGPLPAPLSPDGHFPAEVDRDYEGRLLELSASDDLQPESWRRLGPPFFMAGLAVMLASVSGFARRRLLELAETLHPGASLPEVFNLWLARSPLSASRFLPMLRARLKRVA